MRRRWVIPALLALSWLAQADGLVRLASGWEYRWGDSPFEADGTPAWTKTPSDTEWRATDAPSNPPGRGSHKLVWYRVRLPAGETPDAFVFIYSIELAAELYVDGTLIYSWGDPGAEGRLPFQGWPWHLVPLPPGYGGRLLHVRAASDYRLIGLLGDVLVGPGLQHTVRMVRHDLPRQLVAALSLVIAVVFMVLYLHRREAPSLLLALVTAGLAVRVVSHMHSAQLIMRVPLAWEYVRAFSTMAVLALVTRLLHEMLEPAYRRITGVMVVVQASLFALLLLAAAAGAVRLCDTYTVLDVAAVATMLLLGVLSVRGALSGAAEARLLTANFLILAMLALYGILATNGMLPWSGEIDYLLLFQFSVGLALILARRLLHFQREVEGYTGKLSEQAEQLRELNERLENKVAERTRQLERANRRLREEKISLQITSITDGLTGLYNRTYALDRFEKELGKARRYGKRLSIIMLDLDHFKLVNDSYGHQAGDMVMQRVGALFRHILRESDLAGRYGGEEFLIVLPETDVEEAAQVAERIRSEIQGFSWPRMDIRVTVSGGVAQFAGDTADQLLQRADYLLYRAKEMGRNRIIVETVQADLPRSSA